MIVDGVLTAVDTGTSGDRNSVLLWVVAEALVIGTLLSARRLLVFQKRILHAELGYAVSRAIFDKTLRMDLETIEHPETQQQIVFARQYAAARPYGLVNRSFEAAQYSLTIVVVRGPAVDLLTLGAAAGSWLPGCRCSFGEVRFSNSAFRFYTGRTPEMRQRNYLEGLMVIRRVGHRAPAQRCQPRHPGTLQASVRLAVRPGPPPADAVAHGSGYRPDWREYVLLDVRADLGRLDGRGGRHHAGPDDDVRRSAAAGPERHDIPAGHAQQRL